MGGAARAGATSQRPAKATPDARAAERVRSSRLATGTRSADTAVVVEGLKRKYRETLEEHAVQIQSIGETQERILTEVQDLMRLATAKFGAVKAD